MIAVVASVPPMTGEEEEAGAIAAAGDMGARAVVVVSLPIMVTEGAAVEAAMSAAALPVLSRGRPCDGCAARDGVAPAPPLARSLVLREEAVPLVAPPSPNRPF